jgi:hypothetical protein
MINSTRDDQALNSKVLAKPNAYLSLIDKYTPALPKLPNINVISTLYSRCINVNNEPKMPTVSSTFSSTVLRNASNNIAKQSSLLTSTNNTSTNVDHHRAQADRSIIEIDITNTSTNPTTSSQAHATLKKVPQKRPNVQSTLNENDYDETKTESMPTSSKSFFNNYFNNKVKGITATNLTLNEIDKYLSRSDEIREET